MRRLYLLSLLTAACAGSSPDVAIPDVAPPGWQLLWSEDFTDADLASLSFSDPDAWHLQEHDGNRGLALIAEASYAPPVRSPRAIALMDGVQFGDFLLEVDLLQTGREYGHRDMCVFFGFEALDRFYYLHLATRADQNAHNLFRVDREPRTNFAAETTEGIDWGDQVWHRVRVLRRMETGEVTVWFDDMTTPIMRGNDRAMGWGQIGFGSFDDEGLIDNVRIWGPEKREVEGVRFR